MSQKQILTVTATSGFAPNFLSSQFAYLQDNGYTLHLMCNDDEKVKSFTDKLGIRFMPITVKRTLSIMEDLKALIKVCGYIKKNKINIIIGHQVKGRLLTVLAGRLMGVKQIIIYSHGAVYETAKGLKKWLLIKESWFESALSHKVVCVSKYIRDQRLSLKIDNPKKQYILNQGSCGGIDTKKMFNPALIDEVKYNERRCVLGIDPSDFVVGFCGRMVKDKGIIELLDGYKLLRIKNPKKNIKLLIIGSPEKRDSIPDETYNYIEKDNSIKYTGHISKDEMPYYYAMMSVIILPSYRDGFGMVTIEAGAMGVPAVVSDITGCRETIIDGITGLYCKITPESICSQIEIMLDNECRNKMGENGRKWVSENFDQNILNPFVLQVIED